jgi:hypothetical protein
MRFKEGDYVKIVTREVTTADIKSGMFYSFFCGLAGTVDRIYNKEICIKLDLDTLPEDMQKRHLSVQESIRRKWLNNLSGETRNRLTPEERRLELSYTILVQSTDLEKAKPGAVKPASIKGVRPLTVEDLAGLPALEDDVESEVEEAETPEPAKSKVKAAEEQPVKAASKAKGSAPKAEAVEAKPAKAKAAPAAKAALKAETKPKTPAKAAAPPKSAKPPAAKPPKAEAKSKAAKTASKKGGSKAEQVKPVTISDLEAKELEFLKEREKALKGK